VLARIRESNPQVRLILFDRNYGQSSAIDAGFHAARGAQIAMIDADLQNDPADIPMLLDRLKDYDMATGLRLKRNDPWIRRLSTRIANGFRNWVSGENISDSACGLRVFRSEVVRRLKLYNGLHRFLPTLARIEGFSVAAVPVSHHPRTRGKSKYNIRNRVFKALVDLFAVTWMKRRHLHYRIKEQS
jgi:glycosyltransferase involved in cell wall biosynthesis